jgi:hypothetical protein
MFRAQMSFESFKHRLAKNVMAKWLREVAAEAGEDKPAKLDPISWQVNRGPPHFGIWTEYPICVNDKNELLGVTNSWDEIRLPGCDRSFKDRPPTYAECIAAGLLPLVILDIAIQERGALQCGVEIVHKNEISDEKWGYLGRIGAMIYVAKAERILAQAMRPASCADL